MPVKAMAVESRRFPPPWSIVIVGQALACRERLKADVIAGPAWPLDGRAFCAATRTACAGTQFVT